MNYRYNLEKTILSTYLYSDNTFFIDSLEIKEFRIPYKLFKTTFEAKLIAKAIFNLQEQEMHLNDDSVLFYLEKHNVKYNQQEVLSILSATNVSYKALVALIKQLEEIEKEEDLKNKLEGLL